MIVLVAVRRDRLAVRRGLRRPVLPGARVDGAEVVGLVQLDVGQVAPRRCAAAGGCRATRASASVCARLLLEERARSRVSTKPESFQTPIWAFVNSESRNSGVGSPPIDQISRVEVGRELVAVHVELEVDQLVVVVDAHVDLDADVARPGADQRDRALLGSSGPRRRARTRRARRSCARTPSGPTLPARLRRGCGAPARGRSGSRARDPWRGRARSARSCARAACCPARRSPSSAACTSCERSIAQASAVRIAWFWTTLLCTREVTRGARLKTQYSRPIARRVVDAHAARALEPLRRRARRACRSASRRAGSARGR